jgi:hypothetical protein
MSFMYPIGAELQEYLYHYCGVVWTCFAIRNAHIHIYRDIALARSLALFSARALGLLISGHTWRLRRALRPNAASHKSHSDVDALGTEKRVAACDYPRASGAAWTTFRPPRSFQSRRFNGRKDCLYTLYLLSLLWRRLLFLSRFSLYPF